MLVNLCIQFRRLNSQYKCTQIIRTMLNKNKTMHDQIRERFLHQSFKFLGHSYGNYFNPAEDCSHVVDNVPEPDSGVYWIQTKKGPIKVSTTM